MHDATVGARARIARAAAIVAVVVAGCAGCTLFAPANHDFDRVDAIETQLQPSQCGDVVYTGRYGSTTRAEGNPPTLEIVVVRDSTTSDCIGARLAAMGYTDGQSGWFLDSDGQHVTISTKSLDANSDYTDAGGTTRSTVLPGVSLLIRSE